jgi:hypothetical protein
MKVHTYIRQTSKLAVRLMSLILSCSKEFSRSQRIADYTVIYTCRSILHGLECAPDPDKEDIYDSARQFPLTYSSEDDPEVQQEMEEMQKEAKENDARKDNPSSDGVGLGCTNYQARYPFICYLLAFSLIHNGPFVQPVNNYSFLIAPLSFKPSIFLYHSRTLSERHLLPPPSLFYR